MPPQQNLKRLGLARSTASQNLTIGFWGGVCYDL